MSVPTEVKRASWFHYVTQALGWNRTSYIFFSTFVMMLFIMGYVWWPLAKEYLAYIDWSGPWWLYMDWLLIGIFLAMSLLIMAKANLKRDILVIFVGLVGGLVIESWGTQTEIWTYYTLERPPLWIIPAWPIASLSIDRLVRLLDRIIPGEEFTQTGSLQKGLGVVYWIVFVGFSGLMLDFVAPTLDKSFTWIALAVTAFCILTPSNQRTALLTFAAGSGLGYFLELWGTTRLCWTYYTLEQPPLFAVLAHGMAAVAFWRAKDVVTSLFNRFYTRIRTLHIFDFSK